MRIETMKGPVDRGKKHPNDRPVREPPERIPGKEPPGKPESPPKKEPPIKVEEFCAAGLPAWAPGVNRGRKEQAHAGKKG